MNECILSGHLASDVELRTTQSGKSVAQFRLAVNRRKGKDGKQETDFLPIVVWDKLADLCAKYLAKGSGAAVAGAIQTRSYTAQDGSKRYVTEIIANEVEFLGGKQDKPQEQSKPQESKPGGFTEIEDEDLPF